jgi:hypothetical protein
VQEAEPGDKPRQGDNDQTDGVGGIVSPLTQSCINDAVSHAVSQVNSPILTRFYNSKTGKAEKPEATFARARWVSFEAAPPVLLLGPRNCSDNFAHPGEIGLP